MRNKAARAFRTIKMMALCLHPITAILVISKRFEAEREALKDCVHCGQCSFWNGRGCTNSSVAFANTTFADDGCEKGILK